MEEKKVKIYVLIDPRTNRVRYVGKTEYALDFRLRTHLYEKKSNKPKLEWFAELKSKNLKPIIQLIDEIPISSWVESETYWIKYYKELHGNLLNIMSGGQKGYGMKPRKPYTEERKKKISEFHKGNKYSLGKKHTEEYKLNRSQQLKDQYKNGSRVCNNTALRKGRVKSIVQLDSELSLLEEFESTTVASIKTGIPRTSITESVRKKNTKAYGYYFMRKTAYFELISQNTYL